LYELILMFFSKATRNVVVDVFFSNVPDLCSFFLGLKLLYFFSWSLIFLSNLFPFFFFLVWSLRPCSCPSFDFFILHTSTVSATCKLSRAKKKCLRTALLQKRKERSIKLIFLVETITTIIIVPMEMIFFEGLFLY